ncbi:hypothetical protein VTP21DRAFT_6188 [Calcarisporiella thermophila]
MASESGQLARNTP